ncbi:MAG: GerW family sporulation protein [Candidatus Improbicoccus devescovinae]|nr:MAG: GerW family sporulation protein [Candidatus Improbicoccus devescovinae]
MGNNVENLMSASVTSIKGLLDSNSVIGEPMKINPKVTLIPISKVSYGLAIGGSDFATKKSDKGSVFGGGSGSGITISPVGFLVIIDDEVKFLQVDAFSGAVDRAVAMAPDVISKIIKKFKNRKKKNSEPEKEEKVCNTES